MENRIANIKISELKNSLKTMHGQCLVDTDHHGENREHLMSVLGRELGSAEETALSMATMWFPDWREETTIGNAVLRTLDVLEDDGYPEGIPLGYPVTPEGEKLFFSALKKVLIEEF